MSNYLDDINTLSDLVRSTSDARTMGYEVDFEIKPNLEKARSGDGFFLLIEVRTLGWVEGVSNVLNGEWWFDADNQVMQVL